MLFRTFLLPLLLLALLLAVAACAAPPPDEAASPDAAPVLAVPELPPELTPEQRQLVERANALETERHEHFDWAGRFAAAGRGR